MKIIKLQSQNFKKLKAIEIVPKDNTIIISGKNAQGKSSVLDSILAALAGKDKDLLKPIRDGEAKAEIKLETEKFYINRTFKQGRTELEVISKDGEIMSRPQTFLDSVVGSLSFDPLEFSNLKASEQKELLLKLTKVDLTKFSLERKKLYDERHDIGVLRDSMANPTFDEVGQAEAKVKEGRKDIESIEAAFRVFRDELGLFKQYEQKLEYKKQRQKLIQEQLAALQKELDGLNGDIAALAAVPKPEGDENEFYASLNLANNWNTYVDQSFAILDNFKKRKELNTQYENLTAKIEDLDLKKSQTLESAAMPIPGLSVSDDAVTYNKIPFHQLSSAEKLKVSMAIAMAMNPELRVIRILDGSLLDEDNMKVIADMAKDQDYQVWVEVVDSSGKVGFYVEDGEVVANNATTNV